MSIAISCRGLVKSFGTTHALDGLDLEVASGEIHGFLGPNGAGKTVTLRILLGLLHAEAGSVNVLGHDPWRDSVDIHRRLAYVPGATNLWPNLTGGEILDVLGELHGAVDRTRRNALVERFELDLRRRARHYSTGNRQKVALIAALAADAELLILDEPTSGLDPLMEAVFQDELRRDRARGRTVLLSSHLLAEVEKVCDRVTIIRRGRTVETGSLESLRQLHRTSVSADVARPDQLSDLSAMPGVFDVVIDGIHVTCTVGTEALDAVMRALAGAELQSMTSHPPSLEELFLLHYDDDYLGEDRVRQSRSRR